VTAASDIECFRVRKRLTGGVFDTETTVIVVDSGATNDAALERRTSYAMA